MLRQKLAGKEVVEEFEALLDLNCNDIEVNTNKLGHDLSTID